MSPSHVLWIPEEGSKTVRRGLLRPAFLRVLLVLVGLGVLSIPVLESGLLSLARRIAQLEETKGRLQEKIARLQYVEREFAHLVEKDRRLKAYFGLDRFRSLQQVVGGGSKRLVALASDLSDETHGRARTNTPSTPAADLPERLETLAGNLETFETLIRHQADAWETTPSILPVTLGDPVISSGFGWRSNPFTHKREFHAGIDIIGRAGTEIVAPAAGTVINRGRDRWLGNYLVLQHSEELRTIYGHLQEASVARGDRVRRGERIGRMGNTGLSTSSHLHYSVVEGERAVDPMQFILDGAG